MAANYGWRITKMPPSAGGPYAYSVTRDSVGVKELTGIADFSTALDGVKATINTDMGAQGLTTVNGANGSVQAS